MDKKEKQLEEKSYQHPTKFFEDLKKAQEKDPDNNYYGVYNEAVFYANEVMEYDGDLMDLYRAKQDEIAEKKKAELEVIKKQEFSDAEKLLETAIGIGNALTENQIVMVLSSLNLLHNKQIYQNENFGKFMQIVSGKYKASRMQDVLLKKPENDNGWQLYRIIDRWLLV